MGCRSLSSLGVALLAAFLGLVCYEAALPRAVQRPLRFVRSIVPMALSQGLGVPVDTVDPKMYLWKRVAAEAPRGNATAVLEVLDAIGWGGYFHMSVGDQKGAIMREALRGRLEASHEAGAASLLAVELGTFLGYGATMISREIQEFRGASGVGHKAFPVAFITVDPDAGASAVAGAMLDHAGFACDRVPECTQGKMMELEIRRDYSDNAFRDLAAQGRKIDFLFVDHVKDFYLRDLKLVLELGLLAPNAVVVGDNVLFPGAPDFKAFLLEGDGKELFATTLHRGKLEYSHSMEDEVTVSHYRGE